MPNAPSIPAGIPDASGAPDLALVPRPVARSRSGPFAWIARHELALVMALVAASAAARFAAALTVRAPWIAPDEMVYAMSGRSLWEDGAATVLGGSAPFYGLYPAVIGLPLALLGDVTGLTVVQALQALAMSATAAIAWAWCRELCTGSWALLAAALTVAAPGLSYAGLLMTEALFYPAATLALWSTVRVLTRPSPWMHVLLVGSIAAAVGARLQGVVLLPAVLLAGVLAAALCRDRRLVLRTLPAVGLLTGLGALWGVQLLARGRLGTDALGAYSTTLSEPYELVDAGRWVLWHAGDLFLLVAGIPLLAAAALFTGSLRSARRDPVLAATLAVTLSYAVLTVVEVGVFASRFVDRLAERDLLTLAPPLFVLFAVWLAREAPRPQPWVSLAVFVVAVPAVLLPVERLVGPGATHDAFMTIPLGKLADAMSPSMLDILWSGGVGLLVLAVLFVPRRLVVVLPAVVLAALAASSALTTHELARRTAADRTIFFGGADRHWIDRAAQKGDVTYLFDGGLYWNTVFHQAFWNHRLRDVIAFAGTDPGPIPAGVVEVGTDGVVRRVEGSSVHAPLVVAPSSIRLAGRPLSSIPQQTDRSGLTLWRTTGDLRVAMVTWGFERDGDIVDRASVTVYGCSPGRLHLTVFGERGHRVEIRGNYVPIRTVRVGTGGVWRGSVPSPPNANGAGACIFELATDGRLGTSEIRFEPGRRW